MTSPVPPRRVFHVVHPRLKHEENSRRGVLEAKRSGFGWIDLDARRTGDGVMVNTHWPRPMQQDGFHDPDHQLPAMRPVEAMTWPQVRRLRADPGGYRIRKLWNNLAYALDHGRSVELEPKVPMLSDECVELARKVVTHFGPAALDDVNAKAMPGRIGILRPFHAAGFHTIALTHGATLPAACQEFLTWHRGPVHWSHD